MQKTIDSQVFFKQMSTEEFLKLGIRDIAYIRAVESDESSEHDGDTAIMYSIHAADGTTLSVKDSLDRAISAVVESDLSPITTH